MNHVVPMAQLVLLGGGALLLGAAAYGILTRVRRNPATREQRRRLLVHQRGRLTDGQVTDFQGSLIFYSYTLAGVEYITSQDVGQLSQQVNGDLAHLIGPVTIKYLPRNPANSIVVCEQWSGLRQSRTPNSQGA